jgi:hypothetical protein
MTEGKLVCKCCKRPTSTQERCAVCLDHVHRLCSTHVDEWSNLVTTEEKDEFEKRFGTKDGLLLPCLLICHICYNIRATQCPKCEEFRDARGIFREWNCGCCYDDEDKEMAWRRVSDEFCRQCQTRTCRKADNSCGLYKPGERQNCAPATPYCCVHLHLAFCPNCRDNDGERFDSRCDFHLIHCHFCETRVGCAKCLAGQPFKTRNVLCAACDETVRLALDSLSIALDLQKLLYSCLFSERKWKTF